MLILLIYFENKTNKLVNKYETNIIRFMFDCKLLAKLFFSN